MNPDERGRPALPAAELANRGPALPVPWGVGLSAALAMMPSPAGQAADLRFDGLGRHAEAPQVAAMDSFSDLRPGDWAHHVLSSLIEEHGCTGGDRGDSIATGPGMTRWEAAALLNACLHRVGVRSVALRRLLQELEPELTVLRGRADALEAAVGEPAVTRFSTTTTLRGHHTFVIGAVQAAGEDETPGPHLPEARAGADSVRLYNRRHGATTFSYDQRLELWTSFTGRDLLLLRLRAANFDNAFNGRGLNLTRLNIASDSDDAVFVNRFYYRQRGETWEFAVGPVAPNTEFLGVRPGVYGRNGGDRILEFFSLWGTPGVYNRSTGTFGGVIWKSPPGPGARRWSVTTSYVAPGGSIGGVRTDASDVACNGSEGGIGADCARSSFLAQLGWSGQHWGLSTAWRHGRRGSTFRRGTDFVADNGWWLDNGHSNSIAVNGYWQPATGGWLPSISLGWALNRLHNNNPRILDDAGKTIFRLPGVRESQSWYAGLQWRDAILRGDVFGMAVGQPTFATGIDCGDAGRAFCNPVPADGNYAWEWWYRWQVSDHLSITPAVFYLSRPLGQTGTIISVSGGSPGDRRSAFRVFGALVQATLRF